MEPGVLDEGTAYGRLELEMGVRHLAVASCEH